MKNTSVFEMQNVTVSKRLVCAVSVPAVMLLCVFPRNSVMLQDFQVGSVASRCVKLILVDTISHFHTLTVHSFSSELHVSAQCGHHQVRIHVQSLHWVNYMHRSFTMLFPINDKIIC
jgi:hypothetical protein